MFVGIEKLSLVDFDGKLSCTLFTSGCNFRCPFCHNSSLVINPVDQVIPFDEILDFLKAKKGKLEAVCITGGEPTLCKDLKENIIEIKKLGYLVKLDTNGTNPKVVKDLVESKLVDYIAMDIKNGPSYYSQTIGLKYPDFDSITETMKYLQSGVIDYEFRTTLVQELHSEESIKELGEFLKSSPKIYLQRFVDNNTIKKGLHEVPLETAKQYQNILSKYIKEVKLREY